MAQTRPTSAYDFVREMNALRSQQMSAMFGAFIHSLFSRKPALKPMLG
ncbi:MAG: hypothetical protein ACRC6I_02485 [Paracoccaceae bacterium]